MQFQRKKSDTLFSVFLGMHVTVDGSVGLSVGQSVNTILFQIENISTTIGWTALKWVTDVRALAHQLLYLFFFFCVAGKLNSPKSNPNEKENFLHITSILIYQISLMYKSQTPFSRHKSHRVT